METAIIVFTVIINLFAVVLNFKMLTEVDFTKKLMIVGICEIAIFGLVSIVYAICSSNINNNVSKYFIIFTFLGINMILIGAPISKLCAKKDTGDITDEDYKKKVFRLGMCTIILLVLEGVYIGSILK